MDLNLIPNTDMMQYKLVSSSSPRTGAVIPAPICSALEDRKEVPVRPVLPVESC